MTTEPVTIGGGRYQLGALLGRGGMAEVRLAKDLRLGRTVAIKRLRTDLASDPTFQARFRREAQSAAALNHPTIVAVFDTGEEFASDGSGLTLPYIVMEYVEGRTLRDILREGRKILPERALEISAAVLEALDYSHRAGIVHRDIKPANVMLTPTGDVKVMDFGIARAISDTSATMTATAAVVGTAQYLSPEQARGEQVDARSDLYSAGCLMYELLTGRPPFVGDSPVSIAYQHVREEPAAPSTLDRLITPEIDAVTLKALSKRVDERYQSATEMRADIERVLEGRPVHAPQVYAGPDTEHFLPPAPRETPTPVSTHTYRFEEPPPKRQPNRTGVWITLFLLIAALVIAGLIVIPKMLTGSPTPKSSVPNLYGLTIPEAKKLLAERKLRLGTESTQSSEKVKAGLIVVQSIARGTLVDANTKIGVTISSGKAQVEVPFELGKGVKAAIADLKAHHLGVKLKPDKDSTAPKGQVTATNPVAGTEVTRGYVVDVSYSTGPVLIQNVVGDTQSAATAILESAGFIVKPVTETEPTDAAQGIVTRTDPRGGQKKPYGSTIILYVSPGPTQTTTTTTTTTSTSTTSSTTATTSTAPTS